jgi:hypothetical protein
MDDASFRVAGGSLGGPVAGDTWRGGALVVLSLTVAHNILKTCRRLLAGWN